MVIERFPMGALQTNCYFLADDDGVGAVIDPGLYSPELCDAIARRTKRIDVILLTHGHADHISGALHLREATGAPIAIHALDADYTDSALCVAAECGYPFCPFKADRLLADGDTVRFGSETLTVLHTPGHTPGGVCYLHEKSHTLFSGDTLFCLTAGRTDFPRGSRDDLMRSLQKLRDLEGDWIVYPGHERATRLEDERRRNFFMRRLGK